MLLFLFSVTNQWEIGPWGLSFLTYLSSFFQNNMDTKTCYMCKQDKSIKEFSKNSRNKDGLNPHCKVCHSAYRRQHYLKNRQKYIDKATARTNAFRQWWNEYKSRLTCECGESHPACIQFHHTDDNKEGGVSELVTKGNKTKVLAEVSKCIPICANCHFKLHWRD